MLLTDRPIYQRVYALVSEHNRLQEYPCHRIDKNRYAMLRALTELYITEARAAVQHPAWADSDQLPSLYTNRHELARLVGCGERTVYNCLSVLERAGFVQKTLHGRQNDFELILHPWIVFGSNYQAPKVVALGPRQAGNLTAQNAEPQREVRQNLPPISSYESKEGFIISTNSGVDFGDKWQKAHFRAEKPQNPRDLPDGIGDIGKDSGTGGTTANPEAKNPDPQSAADAKKQGGGSCHHKTHRDKDKGRAENHPGLGNPGSAPPSKLIPGKVPLDKEAALLELKKDLTRQFWRQAREQLWSQEYFGPDYEARLLNLVWKEVFGHWQGETTPNQVTTLYLLRVRQLEQALLYARRHGWTGFLPPPLYFSRQQYLSEKKNNRRGCFWWTQEWIKEADGKRRQQILRDQLARAVHSIIAEKAPRGLKNGRDYDRLKLYHYWRNRLGKYGSSALLDAFDAKIATLITHKTA